MGASYTYDSNGNLAAKTEGTDSWTYTWNAENQLVKVEENGAEVARFAYDPIGRRVEKLSAGVTVAWTYDGDDILREAGSGVTVTYVHGPGIDEAVASDRGGMLSHIHADGLGSVTAQSSAAGEVTLRRAYDAWGRAELSGGVGGFAFTGREWDPEVGLYYYRARYYDPEVGRFLSEDPLGFSSDDTNFYAYVSNGPTSAVDPDGLLKSPIPPWVSWPVRIITIWCLRDYWTCTKKVKEACASSYFRDNCEFTGYECCQDRVSKCRLDLFRHPGDPERKREIKCYPEPKCSSGN
jgi:RHS repeat-associated protein